VAVVALLLVACTDAARAPVPGSAAGTSHAAGVVSAATARQCSFEWPSELGDCSSSNAAVKIESLSEGDTSSCSFGGTVYWGDGSKQNVSFNGASSGTIFDFANHTYQAEGTYAISVSGEVLSGSCTWGDITVSFTYRSASSTVVPSRSACSVQYPAECLLAANAVSEFGQAWHDGDGFDKALRFVPESVAKIVKTYDAALKTTSYAYLAGAALLYHSVRQYVENLGVSLTLTVSPDISMAEFVTQSYSTQDNSQYNVGYDPAEMISSLKVNDPGSTSYEIFNDDAGQYPWSTRVDFYNGPDETACWPKRCTTVIPEDRNCRYSLTCLRATPRKSSITTSRTLPEHQPASS